MLQNTDLNQFNYQMYISLMKMRAIDALVCQRISGVFISVRGCIALVLRR